MSVCGCNSSSPVAQLLDFAEHCAEKIGDGLLNTGLGAIEHGIDNAEHALQFAEHVGERLDGAGEKALQWVEHLGRPLIERFERVGEHLGNTLREDCHRIDVKACHLLQEVGQVYGRMEEERAASRERAREAIAEGLAQLLAGPQDSSCGDAPYHVDPSNGQVTQAGDPYGVG